MSSGTFVTSTGLSGALLASQFQAVTLTDNLPVETGSAQTSDGAGLGGYTSGGMSLSVVTLDWKRTVIKYCGPDINAIGRKHS
jgi:hypothetical protein